MISLSTISRRLPHGWLGLLALFQLADLIISRWHIPAAVWEPRIFVLSVLLSIMLFLFLEIVRRLLHRVVSLIWVITVSFILAFLLTASAITYAEFGEYVTRSMIQFVSNNPLYLTTFVRTYLLNVNAVGFLILWGLVVWVWIPSGRRIPIRSRKLALAACFLSGACYLIILNQARLEFKGRHISIDTSAALALKNPSRSGPLAAVKRLSVSPFAPHDSLAIILVINESFGVKAFSPNQSNDTTMPFLQNWIASESRQFVVFRNAFTNSSATDVSMSSLLTGVAPYETSRKLHTMPLVWDWARAAGFRTMFVSAQFFGWANLESFYQTPGPDLFLPAEKVGGEAINDAGIDEIDAMRVFCREIGKLSRDSSFLAVYNSNALHYPVQQSSPHLPPMIASASRYLQGARILDESLKELHDNLLSDSLLANALIIVTSDHGDTDSLVHGRLHRLYNFYDEIMRIPLLVRVPSRWLVEQPERVEQLRANGDRIVANLDIVPTLVDLLGGSALTDTNNLYAEMRGQSLFKPVSVERVSIALNTNDIRQWDHEGFGIFWERRRFVYSDLEGARLFDVSGDPLQRVDIWPTASDSVKSFIAGIIDSTFQLRRMYREKTDTQQ